MDTPDSSGQPAGSRAELFVLSGPDVGRSFEVFQGATVGRAPDRSVVLRDRSISRHHAHFECRDGVWSIVDDGSTNGFIVDGSRRERADLTDLREFTIGEVLVRLRTQVSQPSPTAPVRASAAPPPASATPPASIQDGENDEIVLEDEIRLDAAPAPTIVTFPRRPSAPDPLVRPAPPVSVERAATPAGFSAKNQRVLQYHKQEARSGLFVTDLAQQPLWARAIAITLALAIAAAITWGVYRGVLELRGGGTEETTDVEEDV